MQSCRVSTRCLHQNRTNAEALLDMASCKQMSQSIKITPNVDARMSPDGQTQPGAEQMGKILLSFRAVGELSMTVNASQHRS